MGKFKIWIKNHVPTKRRLIQVYAALLYNCNIKGFISGRIYEGNNKKVCVPGLNCYSCPGAIGACPLGSLQDSLARSDTRAPFYILGILGLLGLMLGRTICGFLCPVGLGQELLHKIKTPKLKKSRYTRVLSYFKYVLLAVCVIAIPLIYNGIPAFCKYICPAGTLEGAVGLLLNPNNDGFFKQLGYLFNWKFILLVVFIVLSIFIYRFFCRFICPLGAIYGFFNKIAFLGVKLDKDKCVDCGMCIETCQMDIRHVGDHECINCGACIKVCPTKAISWKGSEILVHANVIPAPEEVHLKPLAASATGTVSVENVKPGQTVEEVVDTHTSQSQNNASEADTTDVATVRTRIERRGFWLQFAAWALALTVLITALVYFNFIDKPAQSQTYEICHDFTMAIYNTDGTDGEFNLYKGLESGKIVILNFWYTDCDPCKEELPDFNRFAIDYADSVTVVAVHSNKDSKNNVKKFIAEQIDNNGTAYAEYSLLFGHDTRQLNLYDSLGGRGGWPMTVIISTDHSIIWVNQGSTNYDTLVEKYCK